MSDRKMGLRKWIAILIALYPFYFSIFLYKLGFGVVENVDEILLVLLIVIHIASNQGKIKLSSEKKLFFLLIAVWVIWGFVPFFTRVVAMSVLLRGAFLHVKNYLLYIVVISIPWKNYEINKLVKCLKGIYVVVILCGIVMYFIPSLQVFNSSEMTSIFFHPGAFATLLVPAGIYAFVNYVNCNKKSSLLLLCIVGVCLILAETVKNLISISVVCLVYLYKVRNKRKYIFLGIAIIMVGIVSPILFHIIQEEVMVNFLSETASNRPRTMLWRYAFQIVKDFFPFGSGFGTYGDSVSSSTGHYSSIYYLYGMNTRYGFEEGNVKFLSDTYWPSIIGETGLIGTICVIGLLIIMFNQTRKAVYNLKNTNLETLANIIYLSFLALIVECLFTPTFLGFRSYLGIIMIGIIQSISKQYTKILQTQNIKYKKMMVSK